MGRFTHVVFVLSVFGSLKAAALVIHAAEIGVAKFHRYDNGVHPYEEGNFWSNYILPKESSGKTPLVLENRDGSVTVIFSTLKELLSKSKELATARGEKVTSLNLNGHGLPGGMWFPVDEATKNSFECVDWRAEAGGKDQEAYNHYYSAVSKEDVMNIRDYSETGGTVGCVTGYNHWKRLLSADSSLKQMFSNDLRVNLFSCVVGLGPVGEKFTNSLAGLLSNGNGINIHASLNFGLGDWSIPEGMGFWDYQNDEQIEHDGEVYPVNRKDREIRQRGQVRVSTVAGGSVASKVFENVEFMTLDGTVSGNQIVELHSNRNAKRPQSIRILGTRVRAPVRAN